MKIQPFTIPKPNRDALILQEDKGVSFYQLLHRHKELQISQIISGKGTLIVGDTVNSYKEGDIIVLGGNLPHVFKIDFDESAVSHMITVFFTRESFGFNFFYTEELKSLLSFFKKAKNGFRLRSTQKQVTFLFQQLFKASKLDKFIIFLQIMKAINSSKIEYLSSSNLEKKYNDNEGHRMSRVFEFTMNNFRNEISLARIAQEAAMTKNAFCKYFKKRTNKTYTTFLNELRIEEACRMIQSHSDESITGIAELSGFNNISNFNRKFRQFKNKTPRDYRKEFRL